MEEVGDGEPARARGKTNSKKEDKQDAALNALITSVEGMMNKKDSREEERRRFKEEQMNAFKEIQRRRLEMDAEKQAKMLEEAICLTDRGRCQAGGGGGGGGGRRPRRRRGGWVVDLGLRGGRRGKASTCTVGALRTEERHPHMEI